MRRLAPLFVALLVASVATISAVGAASVVVNGTGLANPAPIERVGRLFVPLRAIFESLGASVVYQSGVIAATRGSRTVNLRIGSTTATVDGRQEVLDAAPFIVGATTYVPLRFVSQALGADVNYDAATATAYVNLGGTRPIVPPVRPQPVLPPVRPAPIPVSPVQLRAQQPAPGAAVAVLRPTISADFTHRVKPNTVRLLLDGADVSANATRSETGIVYQPRSALQQGRHSVVVRGDDTTGARFERTWAFTTKAAPVTKNFVTLGVPQQDANVGRTFTVRGTTLPNARVTIVAGRLSPTSLQDVFSFLGATFKADVVAGSRGNFEREVTITLPASGRVGLTVTSKAAASGETATVKRRLNGVVPQPR